MKFWNISVRSPPKLFIFARQSNGEDGRFVPRCAAWRSLLRIQLLRFPSLRSSAFSGPSTVQSSHSYANRPNTLYTVISVCKPSESTEYVYKHLWSTNILLCLSAPTLDRLKNLAETNFVEIFARAKQILSVQCVQTLIHSRFSWPKDFELEPIVRIRRSFWILLFQISNMGC